MKLVPALLFETVKEKYKDVSENTPMIGTYARWEYGKHPTDESLRAYLDNGEMYFLEDQGKIAGMVAVVMHQDEDYASISWSERLADDQVATLHMLAVCPEYQGRGLGGIILEEAEALAKRNGKQAVRLDALACNLPAQRMYQKSGYSYRGKQYRYAENTGWMDFFFYEKEIIRRE